MYPKEDECIREMIGLLNRSLVYVKEGNRDVSARGELFILEEIFIKNFNDNLFFF